MTRGAGRRRRRRPRSRRSGRRLTIALVGALVASGAAIALLLRVARPAAPQPFRFPPALAATPTVEINPAERARLENLLRGLQPTPAGGHGIPR